MNLRVSLCTQIYSNRWHLIKRSSLHWQKSWETTMSPTHGVFPQNYLSPGMAKWSPYTAWKKASKSSNNGNCSLPDCRLLLLHPQSDWKRNGPELDPLPIVVPLPNTTNSLLVWLGDQLHCSFFSLFFCSVHCTAGLLVCSTPPPWHHSSLGCPVCLCFWQEFLTHIVSIFSLLIFLPSTLWSMKMRLPWVELV